MLEFTVIYGGMLLVSEVLTYNDIHERIKTILDIMEKHEYKPDRIIGITRGGLIPAVTLSHLLDIPMEIVSVSFRDGKCNENIPELDKELNYLIIDDINDSGKTFQHLTQTLKQKDIKYKTAALNSKITSKFIVDFAGIIQDNDAWITFPWEKINNDI